MEISHIVSSDLLKYINNRQFYMCLANIAIKDDNYLNFYKDKSEEGSFILLDNGAAEYSQITKEDMLEIINIIKPKEVILNDVLKNSTQTIAYSIASLKYYRENGYKGNFMFVPQGKTIDEWYDCLNTMDTSDIRTIGIPKHMNKTTGDPLARYKCCCRLINSNKQIHLLGCGENMKEISTINNSFKNIRSCDTALSFIYAQDYKLINDGDRPEGEINFINSDFDSKQIEYLKKNIEIFDNLVHNI